MMADIFYRLLLPMALAGSLACGVLLLARPALRRLAARWHRAALLGAALLYLLPLPLLLYALPAATASPGGETATLPQTLGTAAPTAPLYNAGQAISGALDTRPAPATLAAAANLDWLRIIAMAYFVGLVIAATVVLVRYVLFKRRAVAGSTPVAAGPVRQRYTAVRESLGLTKAPILCESRQVKGPLLVGVVRPRILLPAGMPVDDALDYALRHELTHYKNHDVALKLLALGVGVLYWFNPLAHLLRREMSEVCEASCDEAVANRLDGEGRKAYAMALLTQSAAPQYAMAAGFASPAGKLKKRLARLIRPVHPTRGMKTAALLSLAALATAGILAGCSLAAGAIGPDETSLPEETSSLPPNIATSSELSTSLPETEPESTPPSALTTSLFEQAQSEMDALVSSLVEPEAGSDEAEPVSFIWPVPYYTYCYRGYSTDHKAQDINAPIGTDILASAGGEVVTSHYHYSYGNYVEIDHGNGLVTLYALCDELFVEVGDIVEQGQRIATVGMTGNTVGPHCHFEVLQDGVRVDPLKYVTMPD